MKTSIFQNILNILVILLASIFLLTGAPLQAAATSARSALSYSQKPNSDYPLPAHLRGCHLRVKTATPAVIKHIADWGANFVVLGLRPRKWGAVQPPTMEDPLRPYEKGLDYLENVVLPACKANGLLVEFEAAPWGKRRNVADPKLSDVIWKDNAKGAHWRKLFPVVCKALVKRLSDNKIVVMYNPMSEPNYKAKSRFGRRVWQEKMLPETIKAIRSINKTIWLEVTPGPWGLPSGYEYKKFKPVDDPYIIYGFHFYSPHTYTHQGIGKRSKGLRYPGMLKMFPGSKKIMWDKQQLEKFMMPAITFAKKAHARLSVGEFGVLRWAPGRAQWIKDTIAVFEKHNINWAWHNPAGWNGWNLAFGPDADPIKEHGGPVAGTTASFNNGHITPALQAVINGLKLNAGTGSRHTN